MFLLAAHALTALAVAPPAPTGLTATAGNQRIALTWNASLGAATYQVRRTRAGSGYAAIATVSSIQYVDTNIVNGDTYYYQIRPFSANNNAGDDSNIASATPRLPAPANLTATPQNQRVSLAWNAVANATHYKVKRSLTAGGPYSELDTVSTATYLDTGRTNGTTYYYVVVALSSPDASADSAEASATPALTAPTSLQAAPLNKKITLTWQPVINVDSYKIFRGTSAGGPYGTVVATPGATAITYIDGSLVNGTTYYYVIQAKNNSTFSANSNEASATPILLPPTELTAAAGAQKIILNWKLSASNDVTGYKIWRSTTQGGPYTTLVSSPGAGATTYTNTGLVNGTPYFYVMQATASGGAVSAYSNEAVAAPVAAPSAAPSGFTATSGNKQITLNWTAPAGFGGTERSYNIKQEISGTYAIIASVATTSYIVPNLQNGKNYNFKVSAVNESGEGPSSSAATAVPHLPAPIVRGRPGNARADLSWSLVPNAVGYKVFRTQKSDYDQQGSAVTTNSFSQTGLTNGTTYYYMVRAYDADETSVNSNAVTLTPQMPPSPPTALTAIGGPAQIALSWTASGGAGITGYNVWRSTLSGGPYDYLASVTGTSYADTTNLSTGTVYYYVVSAVGVGESLNSNEAFAVPVDGWSTATAISCAGIRPLTVATVAPGAAVNLEAYTATDWDVLSLTSDGVTQQVSLADTCVYTWSSTAGSVEYSLNTRQQITWIAPATPGSYVINLTVDDQNGANKASYEAGNRDDSALSFAVTVVVQ